MEHNFPTDRNGSEICLCHRDISFALVTLLQEKHSCPFLSVKKYPEWKLASSVMVQRTKSFFAGSYCQPNWSIFLWELIPSALYFLLFYTSALYFFRRISLLAYSPPLFWIRVLSKLSFCLNTHSLYGLKLYTACIRGHHRLFGILVLTKFTIFCADSSSSDWRWGYR